jgi:hypothetical protein
MTLNLPSLEALKAQAKRLRAELENDGHAVSHSRSLELLAHQYGFRDWNGLHAAVGNRERSGPPVVPGERVRGRYLGQAFEGKVIGVQALSTPDRYQVIVTFDEPVDVVTFDSFSAFRQRVTSVVDRNGASAEKTSDMQPHMQLHL